MLISSSFGDSYFSLTSLALNTSEKEFKELKQNKKTKACCERYLHMWNFILIFCYLLQFRIAIFKVVISPNFRICARWKVPINCFKIWHIYIQNILFCFSFYATTYNFEWSDLYDIIIIYGKFWSVWLQLFIEHKFWNWEKWSRNLEEKKSIVKIIWRHNFPKGVHYYFQIMEFSGLLVYINLFKNGLKHWFMQYIYRKCKNFFKY